NYTPAYAVNQVQLWHDFRADVIEKELAAAKKHFGISTLRVYLHDINFFQEKRVLMANIERFLDICARHGIRPGFVFFDGCHRHEGIYLDRPTEPVPGFHNSRWAQSPQARDIDENNLEKFKPYVQEIIRARRTDRRVIFWEIHNEPPPGNEYRDRLKKAGYAWAKEVGPVQPVLNCEKSKHGWADCEVTDIVDSHIYTHAHGQLRRYSDFNPAKGTVFTEAGARWKASRRNFGGPIDIAYWLQGRRREGKSTPGVYLCWELMAGNSNCRWHWIDRGFERGTPDPEPEIPWCGLMWPDATPVSLAEAEAVRRYTTGESQALFFEDFEGHHARAWKVYGADGVPVRNAATLAGGIKLVAGDEKWTDYVLEGRAVIRPGKERPPKPGSAGFIFRVNAPGRGLNDMRGYAVTFNSGELVLGKIERGGMRKLATFDLARLKTKTRDNEFSMFRVAAEGPRIRVWFNRMHPSSDPARGLRIDYTDKTSPILSGAIGLRAEGLTAQFDNIVVLPVGALPATTARAALAADAKAGAAPDTAAAVKAAPKITAKDTAVYELRTYTTNTGKLPNLNARFRDHTMRLFRKHGIESVGYWVPADEPRSKDTLIYVIKHKSRDAAKASWKAFLSDPDWRKVAKESQVHGRILAKRPESVFMSAADFSPKFAIAGGEAVYELRTYRTNPGKLANLDARFRDHTIRIFNRFGMRSVAYWHPVDEPDSKDTLIYILEHKSREAAKASWSAFLKDPEWRKVAQESQKDGRFLRARPDSVYMKATDYSPAAPAAADTGWAQSYKPPYEDANGVRAGGSEIMHIVPHKGKLYAFNGFWTDKNFGRHSAQVLRLDSPDATWQVDLETTAAALKHTKGVIRHMKGNILKSVTFGRDKNARRTDARLLVAASWAWDTNEKGYHAVSVFVRDDATGRWSHSLLQEGPADLKFGDEKPRRVRRVPRDIEVYRDPETGIDRIFMLIGDPGILSGVYNSATRKIEWDARPEHPTDGSAFGARPLGIAEANGTLYFSVAGKIFKRRNGRSPKWTLAYEIPGGVNTDVGGIRGLTSIKNPTGPGESLIFVWTPRGRCAGDIKRLDGPGLTEHNETTLRALFDNEKIGGDATARFSLGGYNCLFPFVHPRTGETAHIVGYEQRINSSNEALKWNYYYRGATYSVRTKDQKYVSGEVNGRFAPGKQTLVAPRAFGRSPFPGEEDVIYFGGHDANFKPSTDMAWIFKAPLEVVLGLGDAP
ncbi:MAG: NIPSNAP family protein, partial [Planctomycetota bacterium]